VLNGFARCNCVDRRPLPTLPHNATRQASRASPSLSHRSLNYQHGHAVGRRWREGRSWKRSSDRTNEFLPPTTDAGAAARCPSLRYVPRNDHVGALQSTSGRSETLEQGHGDREGGIGDDSKWTSRQANVAAVGLNDHDIAVGEVLSKLPRPCWMKLERNDPSALAQQWPCQRAGTSSNIEHQVTGTYSSAVNEPFSPATIEAMPPPSCRLPGHGRPSRTLSWVETIR
jgi:hypothetical protein